MIVGEHSIDEGALRQLCEKWRVQRLAISSLLPLHEVTDDELWVLYEFEPEIELGWEIVNFDEAVKAACGGGEDLHVASPKWVSGALRREPLVANAVVVYTAPGVASTTDDWKQGNWAMTEEERFGGEWTTAKLKCLGKYLHAYATILAKQKNLRFAYIDAFAGSGYWAEKRDDDPAQLAFPEQWETDSSQYRAGSARIALEADPPFDRYIFLENSLTQSQRLEALKGDFPDKASDVQVVLADANKYLLDLCEKRWTNHRAVLFLDPYGMQVDWSTVEAIAATKAIDMWYLFPLGVAVNRLLRRDASIASSIRTRLDRLFGTGVWFDTFYETQERLTLEGPEVCTVKTATFDGIAAFVNDRLAEAFAGVAEKPLALCNSKNVPIYLLCFAAGNERGAPTAIKIAQDIMLKEMAK
jgi:three-Cys-motif partner protein